eukprot:2730011-Pyramimonas_sp.AAC.1
MRACVRWMSHGPVIPPPISAMDTGAVPSVVSAACSVVVAAAGSVESGSLASVAVPGVVPLRFPVGFLPW